MISRKYEHFDTEADVRGLLVAPPLQRAHTALMTQLKHRFRNALLALLDPLGRQILASTHVERTSWPELEALAAQYQRAITLAEGYLPVYARSLAVVGEYNDFTDRFEASQPAAKRARIGEHAFDQMFALEGEMNALQSTIADRALAGTAYAPGSGLDPDAALRRYRREIRDFSRGLR